jgi:hypothetical protein
MNYETRFVWIIFCLICNFNLMHCICCFWVIVGPSPPFVDYFILMVNAKKKKEKGLLPSGFVCWVGYIFVSVEEKTLKVKVQVVSGMGELHTVMGSVLVLLHAHGVWFLPGIGREPLHTGHCWADSFPCRHCLAVLCGLQRQPNLPNGL